MMVYPEVLVAVSPTDCTEPLEQISVFARYQIFPEAPDLLESIASDHHEFAGSLADMDDIVLKSVHQIEYEIDYLVSGGREFRQDPEYAS